VGCPCNLLKYLSVIISARLENTNNLPWLSFTSKAYFGLKTSPKMFIYIDRNILPECDISIYSTSPPLSWTVFLPISRSSHLNIFQLFTFYSVNVYSFFLFLLYFSLFETYSLQITHPPHGMGAYCPRYSIGTVM
jgi:hypothetical protein